MIHGEATASGLTRWCDRCGKRHKRGHEHFSDVASAADAASSAGVTGAGTPEELAAQAREESTKEKDKREPLRARRAKREEDAELRVAIEKRWARRMRMVYGVWARVLNDPAIRLGEEEAKEAGEIHADFALAWGWTSNSKVEASLDVLTWHGTAIAARSKWIQALMEGEEQPTETEQVN